VDERGAIVRLTVPARRMELYVLSGGHGGIVETIAQLFDYAVDVQRAGSAEHDLKQYFALDAPAARFRRVYRTWLENDLDRLQGRCFLNPLRSRSTSAGCYCVTEPASCHDATIAASVRAGSNCRIAESGCANCAADAMGSGRAIAFARSSRQIEGTETGNDDVVALGIALSGYAVGVAETPCLNFTRWPTHRCYFRFRSVENVRF
jgi:hypothetical protein